MTIGNAAVRATNEKESATRQIDESQAYRRFLPHQFLGLLGKNSISDIRLGDHVELNMTILFSDIRDFTSLSESMTPRETFKFINAYLKEMEPALFKSHGFIDKFIGDAIMGIFPNSADDGLDAALMMLERLTRFNAALHRKGIAPIRIGIGLNTGLAMAGAVGGRHKMETTVISDAVNLASRLESLTKTYSVPVLISEHVLYSLRKAEKHDIRFVDRVRVKGKEQPQSVYEVFDCDTPKMRTAKRRFKPMFEEALALYHCREIPEASSLLHRYLTWCPEDRVAQVYAERCHRFAETGIHEGTGEIGMPIVWNDQCEINQPVIDRQHRELFVQVNDFVSKIRKIKSGRQVEKLTAFLHHYVEEHFETEERLMREMKYPLLVLQTQQHARFRADFSSLEEELRKKLSKQRSFMLFKVQLLLVDWLVNHTIKLDKHFGKYISRA